jgi:hypothetical protein
MAIDYIDEGTVKLGRTKTIKALLHENGIVKRARISVPVSHATPTLADVQAAWDTGTLVPGGATLWQEYQLRDEETNNRAVFAALFSAIDANASLQDVVTAGAAAMASNARQLALYTKLSAIHQAATPQTRYAFLALITVLTHSEISKR